MNSVSPSSEENQDAWLTLSLSTVSNPQPQPQPQPPSQPQPQPHTPSFPPTFQHVPLVAPMQPIPSLQENYFLAPPYPLPQPLPPYQPYNMPEPQLLPRCEFPPQEEDQNQDQDQETGVSRSGRARRLPVRAMRHGKTDTITPPYPWATSTRATVYTFEHLLSQNMSAISGTVQCKRCEEQYDIEFDLQDKFHEVARFIAQNRCIMHDRAPSAWTSPVLPKCNRCGQENSLKPVITKKRTTNWLFLLLGQMIGCCKLSHLKYFCKHTKNHRTGAKDRLLYLTYMGLCKQLSPDGPFDI